MPEDEILIYRLTEVEAPHAWYCLHASKKEPKELINIHPSQTREVLLSLMAYKSMGCQQYLFVSQI